jgi:hypothetical protein
MFNNGTAWPPALPGGPRAAGLANGIKFQLCYCNAVQQVFRQQELVEPQHVPWPSCHLGILAPTLQTFSRTPAIQELLSLLRLRPVAECTKCCWSLGHMIVVHPELRTLTNAQLLLLAKVLQNGNRICGFAPGRQQDSYQYLNHLLDEEWDLDVGPPRARARAQAKAGKATGKGNEQRPPWCYSSAVRSKFARVGGTSMTCTECAVPRERLKRNEEMFFAFRVKNDSPARIPLCLYWQAVPQEENVIAGLDCEDCGRRSLSTTRYGSLTLPEVCVVIMQRPSQHVSARSPGGKLCRKVLELPSEMSASQFMPMVWERDEASGKMSLADLDVQTAARRFGVYDLVARTQHQGGDSLEEGHWTTQARCWHKTRGPVGPWTTFDDQFIGRVSARSSGPRIGPDGKLVATGGDVMAFYRRRPGSITEVVLLGDDLADEAAAPSAVASSPRAAEPKAGSSVAAAKNAPAGPSSSAASSSGATGDTSSASSSSASLQGAAATTLLGAWAKGPPEAKSSPKNVSSQKKPPPEAKSVAWAPETKSASPTTLQGAADLKVLLRPTPFTGVGSPSPKGSSPTPKAGSPIPPKGTLPAQIAGGSGSGPGWRLPGQSSASRAPADQTAAETAGGEQTEGTSAVSTSNRFQALGESVGDEANDEDEAPSEESEDQVQVRGRVVPLDP